MNTIHLIGHPYPVPVQSIVWLEGEANYTRVHYLDGTFSLVTQPLQWFEYQSDFIRIHRSAIINPIYVQAFEHKKGRSGWVRLPNDKVLPIARNRLSYTVSMLSY